MGGEKGRLLACRVGNVGAEMSALFGRQEVLGPVVLVAGFRSTNFRLLLPGQRERPKLNCTDVQEQHIRILHKGVRRNTECRQ